MVAIRWVWHAGEPHYAVHADGPCKGAVAAHVARPGGVRFRAAIPMRGDPFVELDVVDTLEELEASVVAWYVAHPCVPRVEAERPASERRVANRPEPVRWPRGARRR